MTLFTKSIREQLLRNGHIDEGLAAIRPILP